MRMLAHIADRVFGRPLLIHPSKAMIIAAVLGERVGVSAEIDSDVDPVFLRALGMTPAANRLVGEPGGPRDALGRVQAHLYNMVESVAVIPVVGSLINRGAFVGDDGSGFTSYEGLQLQIDHAAQDPFASSILLDIDSPGGEVAGAFSLYESIRKARQAKPITALVNDMAASSAYGIAANANEIVVSPGSVTGSVGVVMLHLDRSQQMAKKGIKPTFIFAGAKKVDGNQFEPLSESVQADLQREVDLLYGEFVQSVAKGRPGLSEAAIRQSEAGIFIGAEAVRAGFADRVGSFAETVDRMAAMSMAKGGPRTMTERTYTQAEADALVATARAEGEAAGRKAGETAGASAATARVRAILTHEEAQGREPLAQRLALETDMTAEAAVAVMQTSPKAATPKPPAISERSAPALAGIDNKPPQQDAAASWDAIYERQNKAAGVQPHPV